MRRAVGKDVGDKISLDTKPAPGERATVHPELQEMLDANREAKEKFESLPPSRQKPLTPSINCLKSHASVEGKVLKTIFLYWGTAFIGRDQP